VFGEFDSAYCDLVGYDVVRMVVVIFGVVGDDYLGVYFV